MGASLAASRYVSHLNKKSFQEKVDIWDLYCMTFYYRNCGGKNVKMRPPEPPPFDKQLKYVHDCISNQLRDILRRLHNDVLQLQEGQQQLTAHSDFSLSVKESSINHPDAGKGVFMSGSAVPGTVVMFHPGLLYLPPHVRKMPHYPGMDQKSTYLISRYDGCIIDPNGFNGEIKIPSGNVVLPNPLAIGHMMNHPPSETKPNVMPFSYDFLDLPRELLYLVPNKYYKEPGFVYKTPALMRSLVYVTTNHVCNEELFVNYRLNPKSEVPDWYTAVNKEEDSRRWHS